VVSPLVEFVRGRMTDRQSAVLLRGVEDFTDAKELRSVIAATLMSARSPIATPEEVSAEPSSFPMKTSAAPIETFYPDWRGRLTRNLSRRSTSRWEPLTAVHPVVASPIQTRRS